eukprot:413063_1
MRLQNEEGDQVCWLNSDIQLFRSDNALQDLFSSNDNENKYFKSLKSLILSTKYMNSTLALAVLLNNKFPLGIRHDALEFLEYIYEFFPSQIKESIQIS